uniref:G-protein coupled receptors family 1 profile domain-containing protein n=1 Tax=Esox lucius TaxID=8010 RepID=A0AAY5K8K9_ESOLU
MSLSGTDSSSNICSNSRYLKIVRPLETHALQRVRAARYISMATWATLFTVSSIYLIISLNTTWGTKPNSEAMGCDAFHTSNLRLLYKIVHSFSAAIFFFVLVSLLLLYCSTVRKLRGAQKRQISCGTSKMLSRSKRNMLVLVAVFCVCFVPYHLVRLPYAYLRSHLHNCALQQAFYYLKELTVLLSVLNACLDPLIYFIFCKAFRSQLGLKRGLSVTTTHAVSTTPRLEGRRINLRKTITLPGTPTRTSFNMLRRATIT